MWIDLFLTAVGVLTVTLSLVLATTILIGRPGAPKADRFLAAFLLLSALDLAGWTAPLLPGALQSLLVFRLPLAFLQMPCLLAYVLTLRQARAARSVHLWTGAALVAASMTSLIPRALGLAGIDVLPQLASTGADLRVNEIALHLQFYVYASLIGVSIFSRARPVLEPRVLRWLRVLLVVSLSAHTLVLAKSVAAAAGAAGVYTALNVAVGVSASAVSVALLLLVLLTGGPASTARTRRSPCPSDLDEMQRIRDVMARTQPYLDPQINLKRLSRRVGLTGREVSRLINDCEGMHFFDFVNGYRTRQAAAFLVDPAWADRSVIEIAYAVGFNSKSSFNAAFRKHQGMTPSSVRRDHAIADSGLSATDFA
ncbi:MAG: AraC family transcriptional regulator [Alphaproteobacteria bacterium]|nr:AraC family transcriptional regulator [Alphaproteobacteria bacterium]MBU2270654.1 AraC family transcriptional regulator [Alphaproteobacteria bacterium]MBU2419091.1 AraC family transcriptional regulator [Alphaproteobacteria bacterium]